MVGDGTTSIYYTIRENIKYYERIIVETTTEEPTTDMPYYPSCINVSDIRYPHYNGVYSMGESYNGFPVYYGPIFQVEGSLRQRGVIYYYNYIGFVLGPQTYDNGENEWIKPTRVYVYNYRGSDIFTGWNSGVFEDCTETTTTT